MHRDLQIKNSQEHIRGSGEVELCTLANEKDKQKDGGQQQDTATAAGISL